MSPSETINECGAFALLLPADVCPFSSVDSPMYLVVAENSDQVLQVVGKGIAFASHHQVIKDVCRWRAVLTVDGQLRVNGKVVKPEVYLKQWRNVLASATPVEQSVRFLRVRPVATFSWRHDTWRAELKPRWINAPYPCFSALLELHAERLQIKTPDDQRMSSLEIDLTTSHGARDAWWADDFLSRREDATLPSQIVIEFRPAVDRCLDACADLAAQEQTKFSLF
jgi:hypothetical protein